MGEGEIEPMRFAGILILAYLAGSVNFAIAVLGLLGKGDPREAFSGNAGATNVQRQAGKVWAAVVLMLDVGRAVCVAVAAMLYLAVDLAPWVGLALVAGNRFPCFHGFRGGKGVASYLGFTIPLSPWGAAVSCLIWVAAHRLFRMPFIASFCMVLFLGGATVAANASRTVPTAGAILTVLFIFFNHWPNIVAMMRKTGSES